MQPPPSAPAGVPAPAAPPPPDAPLAPAQAPVAVFPGGEIPLGGLPRTAEELRGLRTRADMLRDQLGDAIERRGELVSELAQAQLPEARAGIQQRITALDERILQIERDQAATDRLLTNASPELLAQSVEQEEHHHPGMVDDDEAAAVAAVAFGGGLLLATIVGRIRRRIAARRRPAARAAVAAEDPRMDRLTQAVEAMAEEVERIGEGQRFVTQLLARQGEGAPALRGEELRR